MCSVHTHACVFVDIYQCVCVSACMSMLAGKCVYVRVYVHVCVHAHARVCACGASVGN